MQPSWEQELIKICIKNKIEPVLSNEEGYLLIVPKMPSQEIQDKIRALIPNDFNYQFREGPRVVTTEGLRHIFSQLGVRSAAVELKDHDLILRVDIENSTMVEESSPLWIPVNKLVSSDPFVENWKAIINDKIVYDSRIAKTMANQTRPERDTCPTKDDILNLRITLENCKDANDFINSL